MYKAVESPYLIPFDSSFTHSEKGANAPTDVPDKKTCKKMLKKLHGKLAELQDILYAHDYHSVLLVFQAMDSAGKDGTIRAVLKGVNPAGCQVYSFKQPSKEELDHDFLWRCSNRLPERGRIGVFNRSYYEEVLVVKVHPDLLNNEQRSHHETIDTIWQQRYQSIRDHEEHLARNGTLILKFWLNVSGEEQRLRFLSRLNEPEKHWKFSESDIKERKFWKDYMDAYEQALNETSRSWAPWYAIPADNKPWMRVCVAEIIVKSLQQLNLHYPVVADADKQRFDHLRTMLENDD